MISNSFDALTEPIVGTYEVPPSAPHSIATRGFVLPSVSDLQADSLQQAEAMARTIGLRVTATELVTFTTPPDPRHDSYDVVVFEGSQWLETAWNMSLTEGGDMNHTLVKAYVP